MFSFQAFFISRPWHRGQKHAFGANPREIHPLPQQTNYKGDGIFKIPFMTKTPRANHPDDHE